MLKVDRASSATLVIGFTWPGATLALNGAGGARSSALSGGGGRSFGAGGAGAADSAREPLMRSGPCGPRLLFFRYWRGARIRLMTSTSWTASAPAPAGRVGAGSEDFASSDSGIGVAGALECSPKVTSLVTTWLASLNFVSTVSPKKRTQKIAALSSATVAKIRIS